MEISAIQVVKFLGKSDIFVNFSICVIWKILGIWAISSNSTNFCEIYTNLGNFAFKIVARTYSLKKMNSFYRNKFYITYSETFISLYEQLIPK